MSTLKMLAITAFLAISTVSASSLRHNKRGSACKAKPKADSYDTCSSTPTDTSRCLDICAAYEAGTCAAPSQACVSIDATTLQATITFEAFPPDTNGDWIYNDVGLYFAPHQDGATDFTPQYTVASGNCKIAASGETASCTVEMSDVLGTTGKADTVKGMCPAAGNPVSYDVVVSGTFSDRAEYAGGYWLGVVQKVPTEVITQECTSCPASYPSYDGGN